LGIGSATGDVWVLMVGGRRGDKSPWIARMRCEIDENGSLLGCGIKMQLEMIAGTRYWASDDDHERENLEANVGAGERARQALSGSRLAA